MGGGAAAEGGREGVKDGGTTGGVLARGEGQAGEWGTTLPALKQKTVTTSSRHSWSGKVGLPLGKV